MAGVQRVEQGLSTLDRRHLAVACAAVVLAGMCGAGAQERQAANPGVPISFHIPALPLANALQAYGETAGVQVLYESNSASGRKSVAVEGSFTPQEALKRLLSGTELRVQYIRPDAITLALPHAAAGTPPAGPPLTADLSLGTLRVRATNGDDASRLRDYSESVQTDIQRALQKDAKTRAGSYRAILDLWIDPSRTVQRTELFRSTGDQDRDQAVAAAIRGLTISRAAPANTPQPVRVVVVVKPLQ